MYGSTDVPQSSTPSDGPVEGRDIHGTWVGPHPPTDDDRRQFFERMRSGELGICQQSPTPPATMFLNASDVSFRVGTDGGELGPASERVCLWFLRQGEDMALFEIATADQEEWLAFLTRVQEVVSASVRELIGLVGRRMSGQQEDKPC